MTLPQLLDAAPSELEARGILHTPREIAQQPKTWLDTVARVRALVPRLAEAFRGLGVRSHLAPSTILLGAGTSDYVGRSMANHLRCRWACPVEVIPTTDFITHEQSLLLPNAPYMSISFSRSGKSPESVLACRQMLQRMPRAPQLIVTCDATGTMATSLAQHENAITLVLDDTVNDRGLAMTSSYTNMVIAGLAFGHYDDLARFGEIVRSVADAWQRLRPAADELAERLASCRFSKIYFLGSGALNGVARESALKVLELTAGLVSSVSETFLGLRHGPMSALDGKALVVALLSSEPRTRRYELDVLREIRAKRLVQEMVIIAQHPGKELHEAGGSVLGVDLTERVSDDHLAPLMVLFGQLFALYSSVALGLRPDAPSPDGVISRVVSGVEMHA